MIPDKFQSNLSNSLKVSFHFIYLVIFIYLFIIIIIFFFFWGGGNCGKNTPQRSQNAFIG